MAVVLASLLTFAAFPATLGSEVALVKTEPAVRFAAHPLVAAHFIIPVGRRDGGGARLRDRVDRGAQLAGVLAEDLHCGPCMACFFVRVRNGNFLTSQTHGM